MSVRNENPQTSTKESVAELGEIDEAEVTTQILTFHNSLYTLFCYQFLYYRRKLY